MERVNRSEGVPKMKGLDDIIESLRKTGSYECHVGPHEVEPTRSLMRKAGRVLGWKVRTHARGNFVVADVIESNPLHQELVRIRLWKHMREVADHMSAVLNPR